MTSGKKSVNWGERPFIDNMHVMKDLKTRMKGNTEEVYRNLSH